MQRNAAATLFAILAALLYAINVPFSKLLLSHVSPTMMAAFLYIGAGAGLVLYGFAVRMSGGNAIKKPLTKSDLPYVIAMVVLDVAAPILLMFGITRTPSSSASLLNNFEIVATSVIALVFFKEAVSKRLWAAIALVTFASMLLGFEGFDSFRPNEGSLLVLGACFCWGLENNCTKKISGKSSVEIVTINGFFSGFGSLLVAILLGEPFPAMKYLTAVLLLGFVSYGLSFHFYIKAQKDLGAAKTSAYYSISPFLGAVFGIALFGERPGIQFFLSLAIMLFATLLLWKDTVALSRVPKPTHSANG